MTRFSQISKTDTNGAQFSYRHGNHPFETKFVVTWHSQICWLFFLELSTYKSISPIQRHMKSQSRSHSSISEPIHSLLNCRFNWESWELCGLCHSVLRWRWIRGGQQPLGTRETRGQKGLQLLYHNTRNLHFRFLSSFHWVFISQWGDEGRWDEWGFVILKRDGAA